MSSKCGECGAEFCNGHMDYTEADKFFEAIIQRQNLRHPTISTGTPKNKEVLNTPPSNQSTTHYSTSTEEGGTEGIEGGETSTTKSRPTGKKRVLSSTGSQGGTCIVCGKHCEHIGNPSKTGPKIYCCWCVPLRFIKRPKSLWICDSCRRDHPLGPPVIWPSNEDQERIIHTCPVCDEDFGTLFTNFPSDTKCPFHRAKEGGK